MLEKVDTALQGRALIQPCYWGEREGSRLNAGGALIPSYNSTRSLQESLRAVGPEREEDYEMAIWELLLKDPLVELRLLAAKASPKDELSPSQAGQSLAFERLTAWERTLPVDSELHQQVVAAALGSLLAAKALGMISLIWQLVIHGNRVSTSRG